MKVETVDVSQQLGEEDYREIAEGVFERGDNKILIIGSDGLTGLLVER